MWSLVQSLFVRSCIAPSDPGGGAVSAAPTRDDPALRLALNEAQFAVSEIKRLIDMMEAMGAGNTPQYRELMASYSEYTSKISEASKIQAHADHRRAEATRHAAMSEQTIDLAGLQPVKGTLGQQARPGVITKGPEVLNLQRILARVGFEVEESGEFDANTKAALQAFQALEENMAKREEAV